MSLVEPIPGKCFDLLPQRLRLAAVEARAIWRRALAACHKPVPHGIHLAAAELAHPTPQMVRFFPAQACHLARASRRICS